MRPASVVIVGAGVMGASVAYHLAARGWRDVLMVDRSDGPGRARSSEVFPAGIDRGSPDRQV
jgi:sarcosine oxidase subunit beta